jgi:ubiquinone biosynthesis protein
MIAKLEHWKRYAGIARLLVRYGRSDLVRQAGLEPVLREERGAGSAPAAGLAEELERMGPTFVKLGQLLSTRPDLLPGEQIEALARLQDQVEPFPFEQVERIVQEELGARISKAFSRFDAKPIASASLGQVHRAALRDGREVAVKVQRPEIRLRVADDLNTIEELARWIEEHTAAGARFAPLRLVEEFRRSLLRELDYRREAANLKQLAANLGEFPSIVVPLPVEDYTSGRVLTMDYVRGRKVTAISALRRIEIDGGRLAEELFRAYLKQILDDGFFHADPHPGNVFLTDDGRIALIDLGMVATVPPSLQDQLTQIVLAVSEGNAELASSTAIRIGELRGDFDEQGFGRRVADLVQENRDARLEGLEVGRIVLEIMRASGASGLRLPQDLGLIGKALLSLDQVGRTLDPSFDPNASVRRNAAELLRRRLRHSLSSESLVHGLIEAKDFTQKLPGRLNRILERLADDKMELRVDAIDEHKLIAGLQKIANRIALGLILASLVIGAALLMRIETSATLFGYPALAMVLFLIAAVGSLALAIQILLHDEHGTRGK